MYCKPKELNNESSEKTNSKITILYLPLYLYWLSIELSWFSNRTKPFITRYVSIRKIPSTQKKIIWFIYSVEQAIFVNENPHLLNLKRKDGEWLIETQSDRVLLITFPIDESELELIDSLTVLFLYKCISKLK